jgi:hypothetical protein
MSLFGVSAVQANRIVDDHVTKYGYFTNDKGRKSGQAFEYRKQTLVDEIRRPICLKSCTRFVIQL